jgi:hypothetical protein
MPAMSDRITRPPPRDNASRKGSTRWGPARVPAETLPRRRSPGLPFHRAPLERLADRPFERIGEPLLVSRPLRQFLLQQGDDMIGY